MDGIHSDSGDWKWTMEPALTEYGSRKKQYRYQVEDQESIRKMSSLSRRACYKCGNVGHYAEVCSSSERLCYNCKQPGE